MSPRGGLYITIPWMASVAWFESPRSNPNSLRDYHERQTSWILAYIKGIHSNLYRNKSLIRTLAPAFQIKNKMNGMDSENEFQKNHRGSKIKIIFIKVILGENVAPCLAEDLGGGGRKILK